MAEDEKANAGEFHWIAQTALTRPWAALALLAALVIGLSVLVTFLAHAGVEEASYKGATLKFFPHETTNKNVDRYVFVVSPQGWVKSPVEIKKGDTLRILAGGSIAIDMFDIVRYSRIRNKIEKEISRKVVADWSLHTPEDYYNNPKLANAEKKIFAEEGLPCHSSNVSTASVEERLLPCRGWTGPDGYPGEGAQAGYPDTAFGSRTQKKISPQNPFGALIGTFDSPADPSCSIYEIEKFEPRCIPPRQSNTFVVGSEFPAHGGEFPVDQLNWKQGEEKNLWLIVNDVLDDGHKFPEKFYVDNLGSFYVEVEITHSRQK